MSFTATRNQGFHITFPNGWTVSVQFGPGNYCQERYSTLEPHRLDIWECSDAEVAVRPPGGRFEEVEDHRTPLDVLAILNKVAAYAS